jgi:hypothetical protein
MQQTIQRRPHSVAVSNGNGHSNGDISREQRRAERREAKLKRENKSGKRRVKRRKGLDPVSVAIASFAAFTVIGLCVYKMMHSSKSDPVKAFGQKLQHQARTTKESVVKKLRGVKYLIPESMKHIGCKAAWYASLREEYDATYPKDDERSLAWVDAERKKLGVYTQHAAALTEYDIHNCPEYPPKNYPIQWPVLDVLKNWPPDDPNPHKEIYQGLCIFDYRTELHKANNYREKELPFIVRDDPAAARTAERWGDAEYMKRLLMGEEDTMRRTEYSPNNHFMYWVDRRPKNVKKQKWKEINDRRKNGEDVHDGHGRGDQEEMAEEMKEMAELKELKVQLQVAKELADENPQDEEAAAEVERLQKAVKKTKDLVDQERLENWEPPTENLRMTYLDWLGHANITDPANLGPDNPHWYFRLIGCGKMGEHTEDGSCDKGSSEWLFDELTYFQPREGDERPFYMINPKKQQGIHCRFGMKGVIAENHFDLSRNAINVLYGQRRYILAHPNQCNNMNLLPKGHPSARHSAVDWSDPDLEDYPTFENARVNEIVMQPGDVLYLPTNWFHYIISLGLNFQCNTRSGGQNLYRKEITDCGF